MDLSKVKPGDRVKYRINEPSTMAMLDLIRDDMIILTGVATGGSPVESGTGQTIAIGVRSDLSGKDETIYGWQIIAITPAVTE